MDFEPTAEQAALVESARAVLERECPLVRVRELVENGFTWEHDVQQFVKRAKSGEALLGGSDWHRERIASLVLA
jgi:hypothetical protein